MTLGRRCSERATLGRRACCALWAAAWPQPLPIRCPACSGPPACHSPDLNSYKRYAALKIARDLCLNTAFPNIGKCMDALHCGNMHDHDRSVFRCLEMQIPYGDLPYLFFGEEQYMLARMWTHGWDMFAPPRSIAYHQWSRAQRSTFFSCVGQV